MNSSVSNPDREARFDVVVVGAGFAGLYLLYRLREMGLTVLAIEAGSDVGGTWYWNRYPGARCDVPSQQYSFSFSPELEREWVWSEKYAAQPEILSYIQHVADRFELRELIQFNTRVISAIFDEGQTSWTVTTDTGETVFSQFCIMATGSLSASRVPDIPGIESFAGRTFHTGQWPHEGVDFTGRRVGVIGTGSSAVQAIPKIAEQAASLTVFQRTPNFTVPARNAPLDAESAAAWQRDFPTLRRTAKATRSAMLYEYGDKPTLSVAEAERQAEFERRWTTGGTNFLYAYNDIVRDEAANAVAADFVRAKIAETVKDRATAAKLTPRDYPIGAKRICVDTDYYATYNRENVQLVDLRAEPITSVSPGAILTAERDYPLDDLVFATGFDAMTGALLAMDIRGVGGERLRDKWAAGPRTYLGLMTAGFPNLFMINGPGSPSVLSNMVMSIEHNVEWITDCLARMQDRGETVIEAKRDAEDGWVEHVNEVAAPTLYAKAASWYMGANIPGKPRVFMPYVGGFSTYTATCARIADNDYEGFRIDRSDSVPRSAAG